MHFTYRLMVVWRLVRSLFLILILDFNFVDLCFDMQSTNWTALHKRTQAVIVTAATAKAYLVQLWSFLLVVVMFGWPVIKKLNRLTFNLLGSFIVTCYKTTH